MAADPQVHFEHLERPDRVEGIARLLLRRNRLEPHVLILCPDRDFLERLDERLWTIHPDSFLAHAPAGSDVERNALQPILLSETICRDNEPQVLINGGLEVPPDLTGFAHIVDFVDAWDEGLKEAARERWRSYRRLGLAPKYLGAPGTRK